MSGSQSAACTQNGGSIHDLGDQSGGDHNEAGDQNDEDCWPVAGIGEVVVEAANLAAWPQSQKSAEQFTLAATRTRTQQAGDD